MASSSYTRISDDLDYYAKAFGTFFSRLSSAEWIASFLGLDNVKEVLADLCVQEPLRILGVGSATGYFDILLMTELLKKHVPIQTTVVEPAAEHIERFQSLASTCGDLSEVAWDWRHQTWEEYWEHRKGISGAPKFHFILAFHVMYYLDDLEQSIMDMMSCLEDGGLLVIMLATGDSAHVEMGRLIDNNPHVECNSDKVEKLLAKQRINFSEISVPSEYEVTECFGVEDEETADYLIDFISHVLHFRETAPPGVVTGFLGELRELCIERGDRLFLDGSSKIQIVKK